MFITAGLMRRLSRLAPILLVVMCGCGQIRLPQIDPSGERIFLPAPNSTTIVPITDNSSVLQPVPGPAFVRPDVPPPCPETCPPASISVPPGFAGPPPVEPRIRRRDIKRQGAIVLQPTKVIAPINADVVILGGLCGADGYYTKRELLEWSLSNESVGHFVEVREGSFKRVHNLVGTASGKKGIDYAIGRTASNYERITRGTPLVEDDMLVQSGQGWVSISSPSEGTSHVSCMAPSAEGWDRRRKTATVHWVDATWQFPPDALARSGEPFDLTTILRRVSTSDPIEGWLVDYTILPGSAPAGFLPAGSTSVRNIPTNSQGLATVQLRQDPGQIGPGITQVRIDITRPSRQAGDPDRLKIASGVVSIRWSSPALTLAATGPEVAGRDTPFSYRLQISNPGDQMAPGVVVDAELPATLTLISANPTPEMIGGTPRWSLGDLAPGQGPIVIDLQVRANQRGNVRSCFNLQSSDARLQRLRQCLDTNIAVPCIAMEVNGPEEANVGDTVNYRIRIRNQCEQPLTNVQLTDEYPEGLEAPGMTSPLVYQSFDLPPGGVSDEIELTFVVKQPGTHCHRIQVKADGGHQAEALSCLRAIQVQRLDLNVDVQGPSQAEVGDPVRFTAVITNTGNVETPELTIDNLVAASMERVSGTNGWRIIDGGFQWRTRPLPPGERLVLEADYVCRVADPAAFGRFVVRGGEDLQRQDEVNFAIIRTAEPDRGPPAVQEPDIDVPDPVTENRLKISITALDEPIQLGDEVDYLVSVTNDRAENDQDIEITLGIPDGMTYVGGGAADDIGAVRQSDDGRQVFMETRRELRAGGAVNFRVRLRSTRPGRLQFGVLARSARSPQPAQQTAITTVNAN